ncbi:MAG: HTTM domain-containing protein [Planctomycetaceae bacterium]
MPESTPRLSTIVRSYFADSVQQIVSGWDRFWFTPADPATLSMIRILAGMMLLYTHFIWLWSSADFFGPTSWMPAETVRLVETGTYTWSHLQWANSPIVLSASHVVAITACVALTLGVWARPAAVVVFLLTVSFNHRIPGALYGLDQVNSFLALYLAIGPCGACYSLDRWLKNRFQRVDPIAMERSVTANLAVRLMQIHLCVIYLLAGLSKLQGAAWWDGTAFWGGVASLEYQSLDLTWLATWPLTVNLLTHVTVLWELAYCVLIWPRLTRPVVLLLAICVHGGIALALGMKTFGLAMLIANVSFIAPAFIRALIDRRRQPQENAASTELTIRKPHVAFRPAAERAPHRRAS